MLDDLNRGQKERAIMNAAQDRAGHTDIPIAAEVRHGSPIFYALLQEMADTHDRKSHDYASNDNPYGNYYFAGMLANLFSHSPEDAGFIGRIGEKIYRLANLEREGKIALNEGSEEAERDIAVIATLWMASRRDRRLKKQDNQAIPSSEKYQYFHPDKF